MKVALVSFDFGEYCIQQANGTARFAEVLLMLPECEAREHLDALDSAVRFEPFVKPRLRQPLRHLSLARRLVRSIRRFQPDVVHFQHGHLWFNLALPWLRAYPLVATVHDPSRHLGDHASQKTPQFVMNFGYRRADRLIVHGEELRKRVATLLGTSVGRIHTIPHVSIGQDGGSPTPDAVENVILFFGRIWEYKGLEDLIRAAPLVAEAIPDAKIVIAGEGGDFERYRRLMVDPRRFVVHNRYITTAERDELFAQAAVVVLPYVEATQSGVIPVAYSFGKPVVATRVGALPEAVDDGVTGLLVPPRDVKALAAAVIEILGDPVRRRRIGAAARQKLDAECSPEVVGRQTVEVYRAAVHDRTSRRRTHVILRACPESVEGSAEESSGNGTQARFFGGLQNDR
jgi:glycosyltransferase involved in cell wall biosynthesis